MTESATGTAGPDDVGFVTFDDSVQHAGRPFDVTRVTTSQQPQPGRHARSDGAPSSAPGVPLRRDAHEVTAPGPCDAGFGEWPYGPHKRDPDAPNDEELGPNPYLPCEEAAPEVRLAPGGLPGTLALLAGLVGLGLALFPIIAVAVWPLTIIGIVLGVVGLRRIRAGKARNSVVAVSGVVLSAAGLALCVAWVSMYALAGVGTADDASVDENAVITVVR